MAGMSNHPVVVFKTEGKPGLSEISGVDILSMGTHRRYSRTCICSILVSLGSAEGG